MSKLQHIELPNNCSTRVITDLYFHTKEQLEEQLRNDLPREIKEIYDDFNGNGGCVLWSGRSDQKSEIAKLEAVGFKKIHEYKSIHGGRRGMVIYVWDHTKNKVDVDLDEVAEDWTKEPNRLEVEEDYEEEGV